MLNRMRKQVYYTGAMLSGTQIRTTVKALEESQWYPEEKMQALQNEKLQRLIQHAYEHVPYYRSLFDSEGIDPASIRTKEDLHIIPLLNKQIILDNFDRMTATNIPEHTLHKATTGGSTGEPLVFYHDKQVKQWSRASILRFWKWAGYESGDRMIEIGGDPLDTRKNFKKGLWHSLTGYTYMDTMKLDNETLKSFVVRIATYRPRLIYGYAQSIYLVAQYILDRRADHPTAQHPNRSIHTIHVPAIMTTAEMLYDHQRTVIEEAFGGKVFNQYACSEILSMAAECPEEHVMHVADEHAIVEFIEPDDGNGEDHASASEKKRIIATDLDNYCMPFIRYDTGDLGTKASGRCACGRGLSVIGSIEGRTSDIVIFENGKILSAAAVSNIFKEFPVLSYQVVQESSTELTLRIVERPAFSAEDHDRLLRIFGRHLGPEVALTIDPVEEIVTSKRGKLKHVISRIPTPDLTAHRSPIDSEAPT